MRLTAHRSIFSGWSGLTGYLYLTPPLVLTPELDETNQLYCLINPDLGVDVYAYTRDQLDLELKEQVAFLWDSYVLSPDEELTESALTLKKNLLAAVREVVHAS
jgi:hypothetical protein